MRNATIEAEVREEAAQEMQEALKRMHSNFAKMFQDQVLYPYLTIRYLHKPADMAQVAASEMKTDRKLDILSRTIPTPAPARTAYANVDTPGSVLSAVTASEGDMSMDQSFESAEQSMSMADIDMSFDRPAATGGRLSDPFLVKPVQVKDTAGRHLTAGKQDADDDDDDENVSDEGSDTASESDDEQDEEDVIATLTPDVRYRAREDTVESEDPLAAMPDPSSSSLTSEEEEEEEFEEDNDEDEDEDEEGEGVEDEDHAYTEEEDDEADEEDGADQESSFAASTSTDPDASDSESEAESEDEGESKFRRQSSIRRRKTGSPIKKSLPNPSSSGKKHTNTKSTPIRRPSNAKTIRPKVKTATTTPKSRDRRLSTATTSTRPSDADSMIIPLGERKAQDKMTDDADEEDEIVPTKPTPKKKR